MNEQQIRQIVQDEMRRSSQAGRFNLQNIMRHVHNGTDSPRVASQNIVLSTRASGNITMAQDATNYYLRLGANFNPTLILFYGGAINSTSGIRSTVQGSACLSNSFYFQPQTTTSVIVGGPQQKIIQSSTSLTIDSSTNPPTVRFVPSEEHIVRAAYPTSGTIVAQATITDYSNSIITILTSLAANWEIDGNWVII